MIHLDLSVAYGMLIGEVSILLNHPFPSGFALPHGLNQNFLTVLKDICSKQRRQY